MERVKDAVWLTAEEYAALERMAERGSRREKPRKNRFTVKTITAFLFVTTQVAALVWVSLSYIYALYSAVKLGQPQMLETLSGDVVTVIFGTLFFKVLENIFEHNDGPVFGHCNGSGRGEDGG